ncbi:MAG: hypothetical protein ACJAT2_000087 [Bacteriovoracaceae bacterium]|jgi:hypothetical protein
MMTKKQDDKIGKAVDIENIDLEQMKLKTVDLPGLVEYAHSVGGFSVVPTEQGVIKGRAMNAMQEQTQERLDMILEQMRTLAKQAKEIQDRVEISHYVYDAEIKFEPVIGKKYFLYEKEDGAKLLSLIGPKDWGNSKSFKTCLAQVRLLSDHTWKVLERFDQDTE